MTRTAALALFCTLLVLAACSDATGPSSPRVWQSATVTFQDTSLVIEAVTYEVGGLTIKGQLCRPAAPGQHPLVLWNHGGWGGLGDEFNRATSLCANLARIGYAVIESSYRGEDGSAGSIEICAGEVDDAYRILQLARTEQFVDTARVAILGGSHGGCITYGVLARSAAARRAVIVAGPTDLAATWRSLADSVVSDSASSRFLAWDFIVHDTRIYVGGTPDSQPAEWARRGMLQRADAISAWPGKILIQHGVNDDIVLLAQSCAMAALLPGTVAFHVDGNGQIVTAAPAACAGSGLTWSAGPVPTDWTGSRYLVVYDSLTHDGGPNQQRQNLDLLNFTLGM
ncbi:MAG: prolyl oligopeptidase family serine peptidase [Gemmatimonadota bacterium]